MAERHVDADIADPIVAVRKDGHKDHPEAEPSGSLNRITRWTTRGPLQRWPWLWPVISFAAGWLGFALVQRGEAMARTVAVMALVGWPWLFAENILGQWLVRLSRGRLSPVLLGFVTQGLQQEILFFSMPFLIGATQRDTGQIVFTALVGLAAFVSTIDPIYYRHIAAHRTISAAFHALCTFIASLVVLPMAASMPLERAFPAALAATSALLLLSLPRMLYGLKGARARVIGIAVLAITLSALWALRAHLPPAGLSLRNSRITQSLDGLQPGPRVVRLSAEQLLTQGAVAFVAIRAPSGLSQRVVFEWWHRGERLDAIPEEIRGGVDSGFRTYSRKLNFPENPRGRWRVDVLTPQGQLICRLGFIVT